MAESKEKLFDQFPPVSTQEWKEKVVADLKGADFDKKRSEERRVGKECRSRWSPYH